ncbi:ATP-grasp ribosomal peptide maturase [Streptomyces sp. NRRL F-2664]|uniref:ATP-grasp ribosomal peptide maturase n=1 Tax=Streptomyces sp. NRRL F-2664 TaxID=1463842 RepID=UPI0004CB038B|nr:ATP-grasp ribosomal peptide maturase [Streptomyces sp. NRRL F-2664]
MTQRLDGGAVLVVAKEMDPAADLVVDELSTLQMPVMRFDMGDFPQGISLTAEHTVGPWSGPLTNDLRTVRLEGVRAVYYRRPRLPLITDAIAEPHYTWAVDQALAGLLGTLYALPVLWVNRPEVDGIASHKPVQLPVAARSGLRTPRSLVTNVPQDARDFAASINGPLICKPLMGGPLNYEDGRRNGVPTHLINPNDLDHSVGLTAHLFQEWIPKAHEVRLTVIGRKMFAAEIHAGSDASRIDWRSDYDSLTYKPCEVPDAVRAGVLRWLDHFGLNFGAFDFAVTPDGEWVFFECNPSGEWSWIQNKTGLPIARALAELLAGG